MKKAIIGIIIITLIAVCFFAAATAVPTTAAEIIAVCIFVLLTLITPVIAITIITNID